jgi:ABC-type cobalamin/Fe3+-siderophores transport system ATPase subunit
VWASLLTKGETARWLRAPTHPSADLTPAAETPTHQFTRVRMTEAVGGGAVTYRDLSEGEQQLLLVLGLLKFTAEDEALFLLDEPDTHLNPAWSTQYLEFLDRFIQLKKRGETCHIIMTSHDPSCSHD